MINLFVMQDRVSGNFGSIFESTNEETVKRDFLTMASNPSVPDYAIFDTVVIHLGYFDQDERNPSIGSVGIPRVVLRGDDIEVRKAREKIAVASASDAL